MIKKIINLMSVILILTGCCSIGESYPNGEGQYIINSINTNTAYINNNHEVEIIIKDTPIEIYSMQTDNPYGTFTYKVNEEAKNIECLNEHEYYNCFLANTSITTYKDKIIGLLEVPRSRDGSFQSFQRYLKYDLLFELDPITNESQIIYQTESKYQRIVGYDEGKAYIYEGNRIYEVDIDTNKMELLKEIEPYEKLEFNWTDEGLTIDNADDGYHELVEIK